MESGAGITVGHENLRSGMGLRQATPHPGVLFTSSRHACDQRHDRVHLVGCGVATGYGSMVRTGEIRDGDVGVVLGVGGVGMNAVQGARIAGARHIVAVDPVATKRDRAKTFGANHTAASAHEALALVTELTLGRMADVWPFAFCRRTTRNFDSRCIARIQLTVHRN